MTCGRDRLRRGLVAACALTAMMSGCGGEGGGRSAAAAEPSPPPLPASVAGSVAIEGSRALAGLAAAQAERLEAAHPGARPALRRTSSAAAYRRLCLGATDVALASRPIDNVRERPECERTRARPFEIAVAHEAVVVVAGRALPVECLTTDQLRRLWAAPGEAPRSYRELGEDLPDVSVSLLGPRAGSPAERLFAERLDGGAGGIRADHAAADSPADLAARLAAEPRALAYLGYRGYARHRDSLRLVAIDAGDGCLGPDLGPIQEGSYRPLARPLTMAVRRAALRRPAVRAYLELALERNAELARAAGLVRLSPGQLDGARRSLRRAIAAAHEERPGA
jgi:phosphate transport system substrate-binding protein